MANGQSKKTTFSNSAYDKLKFVALVLLPALGTLLFALGTLWEWGDLTAKLVGTTTVVDVFLGVVLKINTNKYYQSGANFDGEVIVRPEDGGITASISADRTLEDIVDDPGKHSVEFQVVHEGKNNS